MCIPRPCKDCDQEESPEYYGNEDTDSLEDPTDADIVNAEVEDPMDTVSATVIANTVSEDHVDIFRLADADGAMDSEDHVDIIQLIDANRAETDSEDHRDTILVACATRANTDSEDRGGTSQAKDAIRTNIGSEDHVDTNEPTDWDSLIAGMQNRIDTIKEKNAEIADAELQAHVDSIQVTLNELIQSPIEDRLNSINEESTNSNTSMQDPCLEWYDGLDPDESIYKLSEKISMGGQWKAIGCETTEDILIHIRSCKCDPNCPVLDCKYFTRVPDAWPDCLPEDAKVCSREHGSQLDLLMHTSEYGCGYEDDCGILGCHYTTALLKHLKGCRENERCDVPKCWYFRQLRSHWETCIRNFRSCFLCSRYKEPVPEPRSHVYLAMFL